MIGAIQILHYTKLIKGHSYLMASGEIAHLIGTDILGDASYLFAFNNYTRYELIYPGLPGCVDHPILDMEIIHKQVNEQLKEVRKDLLQKEVSKIFNQFECPEALKKYIKTSNLKRKIT